MNKPRLRRVAALGVLAALSMSSCAETVDDISRVGSNVLKKSDLEGTWYFLQTVTDVPPTSAFSFEGETSRMEKIVWQIERDYLIAYRAYPLVPGAEDPLQLSDELDGKYKENPVAAFAIESHFDITRSYNPSTGEQNNVIEENSYDRQWHERDYMRVDWSKNLVTDFDFVSTPFNWDFDNPGPVFTPIQYFVDEEVGGEDAFYHETSEDGSLKYFDFVGKLLVEPDPWGCLFTWMGWGAQDCTNGEVKIRNSFAKVDHDREYEPYHYDDVKMSKFGYFRSERTTYDPERGETDSGRRLMINRHNIWKQSYKKNADGEFVLSSAGERVPIPLKERELKTIPYYVSYLFPDDELLWNTAQSIIEDWNQTARQSVAVMQEKPLDQVGNVFVFCHNPVQPSDDEACGETGFQVRFGDLRYNVLHWVEADQIEGPLGYAPSATDPVTGETISGKAHIYGAAIDTYATYALDIVRMFNGDIDTESFLDGSYFNGEVLDRLYKTVDPDELHPALEAIPVKGEQKALMRQAKAPGKDALGAYRRRERLENREAAKVKGHKPYSKAQAEARYNKLLEAGVAGRFAQSEIQQRLERAGYTNLKSADVMRHLNPFALARYEAAMKKARSRNIMMTDYFDTSVLGIARKYAGRTDYDRIWHELRAELFRSTALHEVGHTMGLRHNFQGSYDSINYFDPYWDLRKENLPAQNKELTYKDLFSMSALTEDQIDGRMRDYQYSSIMDYGYSWQSDLMGLGKYDAAAFTFGYSSGYDKVHSEDDRCRKLGAIIDGEDCLVQRPGLIEIFKKNRGELGKAGELLTAQETRFGHTVRYDDTDIPNINILERYHYTTLARSFPSLETMQERDWMRYDDYLAAAPLNTQSDEQPVRVPYAFCSDEWAEQILSCQIFDQGADPYEMTATQMNHWRAFYYFDNFRRDRFGWWDEDVLYSAFFRNFLPISDYHQFWWFAEDGFDPVFDLTFERAAYAGFNLLNEVLVTPPYGQYCYSREDGTLIPLTEDPSQHDQRNEGVDGHYKVRAYCTPGEEKVQVVQGDGRRRLSRFAMDTGYYSYDRPLEAGHWWTTSAAIWALTDSEASVIGVDADAGTYAISYYDTFPDEFNAMAAGVLADQPSLLAANYKLTGDKDGDGVLDGELQFVPPAKLWVCGDRGASLDEELCEKWLTLDPETGATAPERVDPNGNRALCQTCEFNEQCLGYTGDDGGNFCQPMGDKFYCLKDCLNFSTCVEECAEWYERCQADPSNCPIPPSNCTAAGECALNSPCSSNETCNSDGNCVPNSLVCEPESCSSAHPNGACPTGKFCNNGICTIATTLVQTDPTLYLIDDVLFWGLYDTSSGGSLNFQNGSKVFRMGTAEEQTADGEDYEVITFTDPTNGIQYGAIADRCDTKEITEGGSTGICSTCVSDDECVGYVGDYYGGVFCARAIRGEGKRCFRDCGGGLGQAVCPDGTVCSEGNDGESYCLPEANSCEGLDGECSEAFPEGSCSDGLVCKDGECVEPVLLSPFCEYKEPTVATRLVKAGQKYAKDYSDAMAAYYAYPGDEQPSDRISCTGDETMPCSCNGTQWVRHCENGRFGACACDEFLRWDYYGKSWKFDSLMTNINYLRAYQVYFGEVF